MGEFANDFKHFGSRWRWLEHDLIYPRLLAPVHIIYLISMKSLTKSDNSTCCMAVKALLMMAACLFVCFWLFLFNFFFILTFVGHIQTLFGEQPFSLLDLCVWGWLTPQLGQLWLAQDPGKPTLLHSSALLTQEHMISVCRKKKTKQKNSAENQQTLVILNLICEVRVNLSLSHRFLTQEWEISKNWINLRKPWVRINTYTLREREEREGETDVTSNHIRNSFLYVHQYEQFSYLIKWIKNAWLSAFLLIHVWQWGVLILMNIWVAIVIFGQVNNKLID